MNFNNFDGDDDVGCNGDLSEIITELMLKKVLALLLLVEVEVVLALASVNLGCCCCLVLDRVGVV